MDLYIYSFIAFVLCSVFAQYISGWVKIWIAEVLVDSDKKIREIVFGFMSDNGKFNADARLFFKCFILLFYVIPSKFCRICFIVKKNNYYYFKRPLYWSFPIVKTFINVWEDLISLIYITKYNS